MTLGFIAVWRRLMMVTVMVMVMYDIAYTLNILSRHFFLLSAIAPKLPKYTYSGGSDGVSFILFLIHSS